MNCYCKVFDIIENLDLDYIIICLGWFIDKNENVYEIIVKNEIFKGIEVLCKSVVFLVV